MISIILPAFKVDYLAATIQSLLEQTYRNYELIIVNDNPGSFVKNIVAEFDDNRIEYYENAENIGGKDLILNWNNCLKRGTGEFILFASDDDLYAPDYLQTMFDLTVKYPMVDLYHCRIRYFDNVGKVLQLSQPAAEYETCIDFIYQRLFWRRKQALQEFLFRRKAIEEIEGFVRFPVAWYTDDATLALLSRNGVAYSSKAMFHMRMSGQNISTANMNIKPKIEAMKQYAEWLSTYLPFMITQNEEDCFMKEMLLKEYRNILFDQYKNYLPYLSIVDYIKEALYINKNKILPITLLIKMFFKRKL
ncbi:glycosyltransferase family 2 protein [Bacteroides acidifaciens]|uniref:glycosyltransferase family 2 protein n=1 Tax=Bacteroides acidifaciens TaxID=85831 RepID=UPI001C3E2362|nr:glycosyltransferase family 2 protein [Bacteroides acidifaciens]